MDTSRRSSLVDTLGVLLELRNPLAMFFVWSKAPSVFLNHRADLWPPMSGTPLRWNKVLRPGLHKGPWTEEEDSIVRECVELSGAQKV